LNADFFPGYPLFWKLLYLDSLGISILNAILGFIGFYNLLLPLYALNHTLSLIQVCFVLMPFLVLFFLLTIKPK